MSGRHGDRFFILERANLAIYVLLLGSHLEYGINYLNICIDREDNDVDLKHYEC